MHLILLGSGSHSPFLVHAAVVGLVCISPGRQDTLVPSMQVLEAFEGYDLKSLFDHNPLSASEVGNIQLQYIVNNSYTLFRRFLCDLEDRRALCRIPSKA